MLDSKVVISDLKIITHHSVEVRTLNKIKQFKIFSKAGKVPQPSSRIRLAGPSRYTTNGTEIRQN